MSADLQALAEGECVEFELPGQDEPQPCFAIRHRGQLYAYRNSCPHLGVTLNWMPDRFLSEDGAFLQCALHGALFRIDDGHCVRGPCAGRRLQAVELAATGATDDSGCPEHV